MGRLRGGGPPLTIIQVRGDGSAHVAYFDAQGVLCQAAVPLEAMQMERDRATGGGPQ